MSKKGYLFQFHKGSIKTGERGHAGLELSAFQFHKGSIKTFELSQFIDSWRGFNSIKVRLRRAAAC